MVKESWSAVMGSRKWSLSCSRCGTRTHKRCLMVGVCETCRFFGKPAKK